jgi:hypothetical protein
MATPKLSLIKSDVHHLGKKPLPEIHFHILKSEIRGLWREGRKNRYELGKKCKQLQDERAHAKNGTYMRDLAEMRIPYHTAQRAIKFYLRAKRVWKAKLLQLAKDKKWLDELGIPNGRSFSIRKSEISGQLRGMGIFFRTEQGRDTMKFTVTWRTRPGLYKTAVQQFLKTGRNPPNGLKTVGRWHVPGSILGGHLLEGDDPAVVAQHIAEWADVIELEVNPVIEDAAAADAASKVLGK